MAKYQSVVRSIESAREKGDSIENYAMQQKIIEINEWVQSMKFYNERFDIYIPDAVAELAFIE